ncbi:MAG TPA: peptidyl-tRNA hydrolase Pth2 [archaeon]|nr:peptidyl-tRNA hydrolase Pth2 [archaeon]
MLKQVIVVRRDLDWGKGKLAAHCSHAAVGAAFAADAEIVKRWNKEGAMKIVVRVNDLKEFNVICKKIKAARLPNFLVRDAGKTQLKKGTITAIGIGPADSKKIDKITRKLKLL